MGVTGPIMLVLVSGVSHRILLVRLDVSLIHLKDVNIVIFFVGFDVSLVHLPDVRGITVELQDGSTKSLLLLLVLLLLLFLALVSLFRILLLHPGRLVGVGFLTI